MKDQKSHRAQFPDDTETRENYQFTGNPSKGPYMRDLLRSERISPQLKASAIPLVVQATLASTQARVIGLITEHAEAIDTCHWDEFTIKALGSLLLDLADDVQKITTLEI